jgi:hypothetical protein
MSNAPLFAALLAAVLAGTATAAEPGAAELLARSEVARWPGSLRARATVVVSEPGRPELTRKLSSWRQVLADHGTGTLVRFDEPAELAGEAVLLLDRPDGSSAAWLYLPAYKKARRLEPGTGRDSLFTAVVAFADLGVPRTAGFQHSVRSREACPGAPARTCTTVESRADGRPARPGQACARVVQIVDGAGAWPLEARCQGVDGAVIVRALLSRFEPIGVAALPRRLELDEPLEHRRTVIDLTAVELPGALADGWFTPKGMADAHW